MFNEYFLYQRKKISPKELPFPLVQRALFYGEGIFTSTRIINGRILFKEGHCERLASTVAYLFPKRSSSCSWKKELESALFHAEQFVKGDNNLRIMLLPQGETRPHGEVDSFEILLFIRSFFLKEEKMTLKTVSNKGYFPIQSKDMKWNFYALALRSCRNAFEADDVLFYNDEDIIQGLSTSNIFFSLGETFFTPDDESVILKGTVRKNFSHFLKERGVNLVQKKITLSDISSFTGAFATNSVSLFREISHINLGEKKISFSLDNDDLKAQEAFLTEIGLK